MVSSEKVREIVRFFVGVSLATVTVQGMQAAGVTLRDIVESYQAMESVHDFVAAMLVVVGGGLKVDYLRMYNFMVKNGDAVEAAVHVAEVVFGGCSAALVGGETASCGGAASSSYLSDTDGEWQLVRYCMLYGTGVLRLAEQDAGSVKDLKTAKLAMGGEWTTHMITRSDWDSFVDDIIEYLMENKGVAAVTRLQRFQMIIPAWDQGGKMYVKEYLKKHSCSFPYEVDTSVMLRCQSASIVDAEKQREIILGVKVKIEKLEDQVRLLKAGSNGGGENDGGGAGAKPYAEVILPHRVEAN
jgi:hypothetical protein